MGAGKSQQLQPEGWTPGQPAVKVLVQNHTHTHTHTHTTDVPGFPERSVVKLCLPMQGTRVLSLIWEDCTRLKQRSPSARTTEPGLQGSGVAGTEPASPAAWAPQQERPW